MACDGFSFRSEPTCRLLSGWGHHVVVGMLENDLLLSVDHIFICDILMALDFSYFLRAAFQLHLISLSVFARIGKLDAKLSGGREVVVLPAKRTADMMAEHGIVSECCFRVEIIAEKLLK